MKKLLIIPFVLIVIGLSAQKKDSVNIDTSYILTGKLSDFRLLYAAVKTPRDVTPNQQDALAKWIEGIKPQIDSVKVAK